MSMGSYSTHNSPTPAIKVVADNVMSILPSGRKMCLFVFASPLKLAIKALLSTLTIAVPSNSDQNRSPIVEPAMSTALPIAATATPSAPR